MGIQQEWARFRAESTPKGATLAGRRWEYVLGPGSTGETVLLLPGGLNSAEAFFPLIVGLGRAARVIAVRYPAVATISALLDGLLALLDAEGARRVRVLGTSLGGAVAQCLVRRAPARVGALALANTFAPNPAVRARLRRNGRAVAALPGAVVRWLAGRRVLPLAAAVPPAERPFWRAFLAGHLAAPDTKGWLVSQYRLLADYCGHYRFAPDDLQSWPGRMLIVQADDDPLVARLAGGALPGYYPGARVHTLRGGHLPFLTARAEYEAVVAPFLLEAPWR